MLCKAGFRISTVPASQQEEECLQFDALRIQGQTGRREQQQCQHHSQKKKYSSSVSIIARRRVKPVSASQHEEEYLQSDAEGVRGQTGLQAQHHSKKQYSSSVSATAEEEQHQCQRHRKKKSAYNLMLGRLLGAGRSIIATRSIVAVPASQQEEE